MDQDQEVIRKQLAAFFYSDELEWKVQTYNSKNRQDATKAMVVPYIQARAIMERLDDVVGINNWRDEYMPGPGGGIVCALSLRISGEWITKHDGAENSDVEEVKGGISNALKRAAVKWGIGRYLYDIPKMWFPLNDRKFPVYKDKQGQDLDNPPLPRRFLPADATAIGTRPVSGTSGKNVYAGNKAPAKMETKSSTPEPAEVQQPEPAPAQDAVPSGEHDLAWALAVIVPEGIGVLKAGKPFKDVVADTLLAPYVVSYLSGKHPNASGNTFTPIGSQQETAQEAAQLILSSDPAKFDVGQKKK